MKKLLSDLYEEIKHGDEDHQKWLKDKIEEFENSIYLIDRLGDVLRIGGVRSIDIHCTSKTADAIFNNSSKLMQMVSYAPTKEGLHFRLVDGKTVRIILEA